MELTHSNDDPPLSLEEQLTCSIRRAKQTITSLNQPATGATHRVVPNSTTKEESGSSSPAIASIVSSLQTKVADLTKSVQAKDKQIALMENQIT